MHRNRPAQRFCEEGNKWRAQYRTLISCGAILMTIVLAGCGTTLKADSAAERVETPTGPPDLTFSWVNCASPKARVFDIELWSNGVLRYRGSGTAKQVGALTEWIRPADARALIDAGKRFARERKGLPQDALERHSPHRPSGRHCLLIQVSKANAPAMANLYSRSAGQFNERAQGLTKFGAHVCPPRENEFFSVVGGCRLPVVTLIYDQEAPCYARHVTSLYASGDVQYKLSNVPQTESFYTISREQLIELARLAKSFTVMDIEATSDGPEMRHINFYGSEEELIRFRAAVETVTDLKWIRLESGNATCLKIPSTRSQLQRKIMLDEKFVKHAATPQGDSEDDQESRK